MIKINLSPVNMDRPALSVSSKGQVLTVDGVDYDLSLIPDGATADHPVIHNCTRNGNNYELTLMLPHGDNAPAETRFPTTIEVVSDGKVALPPYGMEANK